MKKELKQWAWDMYRTIESAVERINNDTLSDKDAVETANMLLQLDHEVRNDPEYHTDSSIPAISVSLNELYDALNSRDAKSLRLDNDIFRQVLSFGEVLITKEERVMETASARAEDGRTYIDFLPRMPHEQYLKVVENLKELGAKYDPEVKQWYVNEGWEPKKMDQQHEKTEGNVMTSAESDKKAEQNEQAAETGSKDSESVNQKQFKAIYYDNSERKEIYSESKEEAIDTIRRLKAPVPVNRFLNAPELKENERCYIQKYDAADQQYKQEGIYLIASGRDVTPVEIHLPYMRQETFKEAREELRKMGAKFDGGKKIWYAERGDESLDMDALQSYLNNHDDATYLQLPKRTTSEQFKEIIGQLKQDGARYNPNKKAWYITDRNDTSKFLAYLPSDPGSIHAKLEQNKRAAATESKDSGKERTMEPRKKDEHIV